MRKITTHIFLIFLILIFSLNSGSALVRSKIVDGPSEIQFSLTIDLNSTELQPGPHNITILLTVTNFSDAISLTSTVVQLSIRGDVEYYSTDVNIGTFTIADFSATANTTFMFQDYWGPVTMYLKVKYVVNRASTTSRTLDTGWIEFVDLTTFIDDPYEDPLDPLPWGLFIALIVIGLLSLLGTIIFFSIRRYMQFSPRPALQQKHEIEVRPTVNLETEPKVMKAKQMPSKKIPLLKEYCSICGNKTEADARFCTKCGQTLKS